jgi:hypothetical protein
LAGVAASFAAGAAASAAFVSAPSAAGAAAVSVGSLYPSIGCTGLTAVLASMMTLDATTSNRADRRAPAILLNSKESIAYPLG